MQTSLKTAHLHPVTSRLARGNTEHSRSFPGDAVGRQPLHTVYGGAHLFRPQTLTRLGELAREALARVAPNEQAFLQVLALTPEQARAVHSEGIYERVRMKLEREAVEDYRIDFEDGFGVRAEAEEDAAAVASAEALSATLTAGTVSPFIGLRIKPFTGKSWPRAVRTLDLFLTALERGKVIPARLLITLPKVVGPFQVEALAELCTSFEEIFAWPAQTLKIEVMIETTELMLGAASALAPAGAPMPQLYAAAGGRLWAAHLGAYDYTAACQVSGPYQSLAHPACDFARQMMLAAFAGQPVWLADGATTLMPLGDQVENAWRLSFRNIRRALSQGFYQGWDLHPAQIPVRYAATYSFFREALPLATARLKAFLAKEEQATLSGAVFDDAATGRGLVNFFQRALSCGALTEAEAEASGIYLAR